MLRLLTILLATLPAVCGLATPPETVRLAEGDLLTGLPGAGPLDLAEVRAWLAEPANHRLLAPELPLGLDGGAADVRGLEANPLTRAKIELGRQLFFDPRLSRDGTISCASCHDPEHGYAFPSRFGVGVEGQQGVRNSPTAANRILSTAQFWDGRAATLEAQAVAPMANPVEMGFTHDAVVEVLRRVGGYVAQFEAVFGEGPTIDNTGAALAAFERALVSGPNPWDVHQRLETLKRAGADDDPELVDPELAAEYEALQRQAAERPLSEAARRGASLFYGPRTGCTLCHAGANFSDELYHNLGVGMEAIAGLADDAPLSAAHNGRVDWGRYEVTHDEADRGAFKTPSLRNLVETGPYMHDGSLETLDEVVAWYVRGGLPNRFLSPLIEPLDLSAQEQADLVAFLEALRGDWPRVERGRLP